MIGPGLAGLGILYRASGEVSACWYLDGNTWIANQPSQTIPVVIATAVSQILADSIIPAHQIKFCLYVLMGLFIGLLALTLLLYMLSNNVVEITVRFSSASNSGLWRTMGSECFFRRYPGFFYDLNVSIIALLQ